MAGMCRKQQSQGIQPLVTSQSCTERSLLVGGAAALATALVHAWSFLLMSARGSVSIAMSLPMTAVSPWVSPDCTKSAARLAAAAVRVGDDFVTREDLHKLHLKQAGLALPS